MNSKSWIFPSTFILVQHNFSASKVFKSQIDQITTLFPSFVHPSLTEMVDLSYNPLNSGSIGDHPAMIEVNTNESHEVSTTKPTKEADKLTHLFEYNIVQNLKRKAVNVCLVQYIFAAHTDSSESKSKCVFLARKASAYLEVL
ncbi:Uncharacterized protein Fot_23014 [Forsythia ovata]|uniref:Uncharacterized protein n=1 Tax=Forsythia ovata TaxID=205694 RepID=A0ABD1UZC7_9LAMI